jgi:hypothetical protein
MARKKPDRRIGNNGLAKIKNTDIPTIIELSKEHCWGEIGRMYGVTGSVVSKRVKSYQAVHGGRS